MKVESLKGKLWSHFGESWNPHSLRDPLWNSLLGSTWNPWWDTLRVCLWDHMGAPIHVRIAIKSQDRRR
jgi:hypothetical protein